MLLKIAARLDDCRKIVGLNFEHPDVDRGKFISS